MQFQVIGSCSGMPETGKSNACLWVKVNNKNLLFDAGEGTCRNLIKNGLTGDTVDAIFISHFHPDHLSGIFMVLQMFNLQKRTKKLYIYLPEQLNEFNTMLNSFYIFKSRYSFEIVTDLVEKNVFEEVSTVQSDHMVGYIKNIEDLNMEDRLNSVSYVISSDTKKLVYTSDVSGISEELETIINISDSVVVDAMHPSAEEILSLDKTDIKRIILNHGISRELADSIKLDGKFEYADENKIFTI